MVRMLPSSEFRKVEEHLFGWLVGQSAYRSVGWGLTALSAQITL